MAKFRAFSREGATGEASADTSLQKYLTFTISQNHLLNPRVRRARSLGVSEKNGKSIVANLFVQGKWIMLNNFLNCHFFIIVQGNE